MPDFQEAVRDMRAASRDKLVGLVLRLNRDDNTVRTLFSESSDTQPHRNNPPQADRCAIFHRFNDQPDQPENIQSSSTVNAAAGFHAEEIMIMSWPAILAQANLQADDLTHVDLVLSKSPCNGRSGSTPMIVDHGSGGRRYLTGCAQKLTTFCRDRPQVKFSIYFVALAGANADRAVPPPASASAAAAAAAAAVPGGYTQEAQPGQELTRHMTPEEHALMPARDQLKEASEDLARRISKNDRAVQAAAAKKANQQAAQQLAIQTKQADQRAGRQVDTQALRDATTAYKASQLEHTKTVTAQKRLLAKRTALFDAARTKSLHTAQAGIVDLTRLHNVSVTRWDTAVEAGW